jgi:L-lactate dehydrogenase
MADARRGWANHIAGRPTRVSPIGNFGRQIVDVLIHDQRAILTICARVRCVPDCDGVTLALPHLVGGDGVLATIPLALDVTEREGLRRSANVLREAMASLNLS